MVDNKINFDILFRKLLINDKDGMIINELIEQNILDIIDVNNYVVTSNNFKYLYFFAKYVKYADIEKIENKVIELGNLRNIYIFFNDVSGIDFDKFERIIINSKNAEYIYKFAKEMPNADIKLLEDAIINTSNSKYICSFAEGISGADINSLGYRLIELGDVSYITRFVISLYQKISEELMNKIVDRLIELGNARCLVDIFIFTGFSREKIVNALIEIGDADSLYRVSPYLIVLNVDFGKFANAILNTNNPIYISSFFSRTYNSEYFSESMCKKFENVLIGLGDKCSLDSYYRDRAYYYKDKNKDELQKVHMKKRLMKFLKK